MGKNNTWVFVVSLETATLHLRSFKTPPSSEARAVMSDEDSAQLKADCAFSMRKGVKSTKWIPQRENPKRIADNDSEDEGLRANLMQILKALVFLFPNPPPPNFPPKSPKYWFFPPVIQFTKTPASVFPWSRAYYKCRLILFSKR